MSTATLTADAPVYTDTDRDRDVALCRAYFGAWTSSFGTGRNSAQHESITFEDFQAAADRLAR